MRKIASILLIITLLFTISACGQKTDSEPQKNNDEVVESSNDSKKGENTKKEDIKKEADSKIKEVKKDETVSLEDYCELKINDTKFGKTINPPNPESFYTYYESKDAGKIYLDSVIDVKNLLTEAKMADEFLSVKVVYDNKYEYNTFSVIEEDGGSNFTYTNITSIDPLTNGVLHFLATVPESIENDSKSLVIIIKANNQEFKYNIR